jgi:hypothetical protein
VTDTMLSTIPMSVAFICASEEARVSKAAVLRRRRFFPDDDDGGPRLVRLTPTICWTIWLAQLADGRALVQAGTQIDIGHEVFLPNPGAAGFLAVPKIVASIDRTTRAATKEWLITWDGTQASLPADAPLVQAQLAPEWFTQPLLRWIHETARTCDTTVDLAGFAEHDVLLGSVVTLADRLASDGLIIVGSSGQTATATLTVDGVTAAEQAAAARADPRQRTQALRQGMITWLADRENASDAPHDWTRFLRDPRSTFCGDFFTTHDLAREAQYLAEHGLIRGLAARDGTDSGWTLPRLTAKGRDCNDDYGGNVAESLKPEQPGRSTRISVTGSPGTQINAGDHNSQHASPAPATATPQPPAENTAWWRKAGNFLTSLAGIVTMAGTVAIAVLTYLTYLLLLKH